MDEFAPRLGAEKFGNESAGGECSDINQSIKIKEQSLGFNEITTLEKSLKNILFGIPEKDWDH